MKIKIMNEVTAVENGSYKAEIVDVFEYTQDKICMKLALADDLESRILVKFFSAEELGVRPWNSVFLALDADDTDALLNKTVEFEVINSVSRTSGKEFCNITKVTVIS